MKKLLLVVVALALVALGGCYAGVGTMGHVPGLLYADTKFPLEVGANSPGARTGEAMAKSILGLVSLGDCSVDAAAKAGGITRIATVERHVRNILGVYAEYTTIVTGD